MKMRTARERKLARRLNVVMRARFNTASFGIIHLRAVIVDHVLIGYFFEDLRGVSGWDHEVNYLGRFPNARKAIREMARRSVCAERL